MRRIWTRMILLLLCLALLCGGVFAGEVTLAYRFRPIGEGLFAADSIYGVEVHYQTGTTIYCSELVSRYYETLYGLTVLTGDHGPTVRDDDTYWFEPTETPTAGDVAFASPARRGKSYGHYALVKYADAETDVVTLLEQNWSYNDQASYERTIPYDNDCYVFYTLRCKSGTPKAKLPVEDTVSAWAKDYVDRADALGLTDGLVAGYRRTITRGVLARLCVNAAELAGIKVDQSNPYGAACALGIMSKDSDNEFGPWLDVDRASAAVVLSRLLDVIGSAPQVSLRVLQSYSDSASLPAWAKTGIAVMTAAGLMTGEDGAFGADEAITAEEVIVLLVRMLENPAPADLTAAAPAAQKAAVSVQPKSAGAMTVADSAVSQLLGRSY